GAAAALYRRWARVGRHDRYRQGGAHPGWARSRRSLLPADPPLLVVRGVSLLLLSGLRAEGQERAALHDRPQYPQLRRRAVDPILSAEGDASMYDLLLKGGTVIDPAQDLRGALDVAIEDGKIAGVAANIPKSEARRVIDVPGKTVTAGLIDLHTHVFDGVAANGVHPDIAGVHAGVTTVVDAGSSGCATFSAFPRHILPQCETEVIPLLHICQTGLATNPDIIAESSIDLESTLRVAREHRGLIKGIKARMVSPALEIFGMEMPRLAKRAARESGVPLMVHIGDTTKRYDPNVIRELLPLLEPGDIV